ncbi:MAG: hypothetical protein RLZ04_1441, partial [Actinomycetota bacterium]
EAFEHDRAALDAEFAAEAARPATDEGGER